jgi:hypothetical protein
MITPQMMRCVIAVIYAGNTDIQYQGGSLIHPLHARPTFKNPIGRLDARHDSRSRFFLETERLGSVLDERVHVGKQQGAALRENSERAAGSDEQAVAVAANQLPEGFGSTDEMLRAEAVAALNIHRLFRAATEIEREEFERRKPPIPVLSNSEAFGLQALVTATEFEVQPALLRAAQMHAPESQCHTAAPGPSVKLEPMYTDRPPHTYPANRMFLENGFDPQTPRQSSMYEPSHIIRNYQTPISNTPVAASSVGTQPIYSHSRTASESTAAAALNTPPTQQGYRARRGYSTSAASANGPMLHQPFAGAEFRSSPSRNSEYSPHSARMHEAQRVGQHQPFIGNSSTEERSSGSFWQNVLSDGEANHGQGTTYLPQIEDSLRRRSEANIGTGQANGSFGDIRKHSSPVIADANTFRPRSPPPSRSPQTLQSLWRQPTSSLPPPPPPPPPTGPATGPPPTSIYYQPVLPRFAVPYVVYAQHPPPSTPQQQPPSQQQHGIFFGPPPPPQFGPPAGPQQQYPWYKQ